MDLHEQLASKNTTTASTSPNPPKKKKPKTSHQSSSPNTNKSPKVDISTEQGQVRASPKTATHSSPKTQVYASPKTPTHAPPKAPLLSPPDLQRQRPFTSPFHSYGLSKGVTESSPQAVAPLKITLPRGSIGSVSPSSLQLQQSVEQRPSIPGQNLSVKSGPLGSNQRIIVQQYPSIQSQAKDDSDSSSQ